MIEKTIGFISGHNDFKLLGASRTDSKVSAHHSAVELFVSKPLNTDQFLMDLNQNLPNDIRALKIQAVDRHFNIINDPGVKEYVYLFSSGQKAHPFCASMMSSFAEALDLGVMKQGARLFEGRHNFIQYCTKPTPGRRFERDIQVSRIEENTLFSASFFPAKTYIYRIRSKGFLRYQVRLIMGQLLSLGRSEIGLADIKISLEGKNTHPLRHIAPSSGLILHKIEFDSL